VITASAARRELTRKARAESIRSQVRAELDRAAREYPLAVEAAEVEPVEAVEIPRPVRPSSRGMNRHARREARRRGCLARSSASVLGLAIHEPENCDGTCHAGELFPPRSPLWFLVVLVLVQLSGSLGRRPKCPAAPASDELCECGAHYMTDRPSRMPGGWEAQLTEAQRRTHEHHFGWVLAVWQATVWRPEAAAELARLRPDDRPADSAWARLRLVLEAFGVLLSRNHGPPGVGGVVVLCHPRIGPPVARRVSEAPVICP
jgi:hypothetical protein